MEYDAIWQAFSRTGDPLYYLLYKGLGGDGEKAVSENGSGDEPRPAD